MKQDIVITVGAALLTGCSVLSGIDSNYPDDWPTVITQQDFCAQVAGNYLNHGSATYSPKGGSPFLTYRFGMSLSTIEETNSYQSINIECIDDESILVQALSDSGKTLIKTVSLEEEGWRIEKDVLHFPIIKESEADGLGGFIKRTEFRLTIAEDGSLIGEEKSSGAGLALWFIPIGGSQTFWFQWSRLTTE